MFVCGNIPYHIQASNVYGVESGEKKKKCVPLINKNRLIVLGRSTYLGSQGRHMLVDLLSPDVKMPPASVSTLQYLAIKVHCKNSLASSYMATNTPDAQEYTKCQKHQCYYRQSN
jgi:hypothetical protein